MNERHNRGEAGIARYIFPMLILLVIATATTYGQQRDLRAERVVIDDNGDDGTQNTMAIQTPTPLGQDMVLTIPDMGTDSAQFLLFNPTTNRAAVWLLSGNAGTTAGTNFVGTTDTTALHLYVNGGSDNSLILNTNGSIQRDTAGDARGEGAIDLQSFRSASTEAASGQYSVIGGGRSNTAPEFSSVVAGGFNNIAGGGFATISGGLSNTVSRTRSTISGGEMNTASGGAATISGGGFNTASGHYSTVSGGDSNLASGYRSTVSGGMSDTASGDKSSVGGGLGNTASGISSSVGGGEANRASGLRSTVSGGHRNVASGDHSAIPGGHGLTLDANADGSFGFLGGNNGAKNMTISTPNVAVFGNTDLWLTNNTGSARRIRFYEAESDTGAFPSSTNYTSFEAQAQTADIEYILPAAAGTVGQQLTVAAVAGTEVTLNWAAASDRAKKTDFLTLSGEGILIRFRGLELGTWRYDPAIDPKGTRHYGIMAQDFHAAFGHDGVDAIGTDTTVTDLDLHGVSYLAIQGLEERTAGHAEELRMLRREIELLRVENLNLRRSLDQLNGEAGRKE